MPSRRSAVPDAQDLRAIQALAASFPERATHAVDLPYSLAWVRLGQEGLGSQVETALWYEDIDLVAWAVWSPSRRGAITAVHPAHAAGLGPEILAWSEARARALARLAGGRLSWWMAAREDDPERVALLEANGFHRAEWTMLRYERALMDLLPPPALPDGFVVRPLGGAEEVPAYVATHRAAFGSTAMTVEWRERILQVPGYRPEIDLVVAAPDGRVASFAIMWLGPESGGRREGQFEPVGTHPDYHRRGLGQALMLEGMRRLRVAGATHAIVETENVRVAANALYGLVMRQTSVRTLYYRKDLEIV